LPAELVGRKKVRRSEAGLQSICTQGIRNTHNIENVHYQIAVRNLYIVLATQVSMVGI